MASRRVPAHWLGEAVRLSELDDVPVREGMVGVFCALLELVKLGVITAHQEAGGDAIRVRSAGETGEDLENPIGVTSFLDEELSEDGLTQDPSESEARQEPGSDPSLGR